MNLCAMVLKAKEGYILTTDAWHGDYTVEWSNEVEKLVMNIMGSLKEFPCNDHLDSRFYIVGDKHVPTEQEIMERAGESSPTAEFRSHRSNQDNQTGLHGF